MLNNKNTDTVIFDLDGTLLDTLDDLTNATNYVLNTYGYLSRTRDEVKSFVGNGLFMLIARAIPEIISKEDMNKAFLLLRDYYTKNCKIETKPFEGITDMLLRLKKEGYKLAVVSNKNNSAVKELCDYYFNGLINTAVGERDSVRRKPYPDSINEVLKVLNSDREKSVYVGDSEVDKYTADNANMKCILVDWGFRTKQMLIQYNPEIIIDEPNEIFKYLK